MLKIPLSGTDLGNFTYLSLCQSVLRKTIWTYWLIINASWALSFPKIFLVRATPLSFSNFPIVLSWKVSHFQCDPHCFIDETVAPQMFNRLKQKRYFMYNLTTYDYTETKPHHKSLKTLLVFQWKHIRIEGLNCSTEKIFIINTSHEKIVTFLTL